MASSNSHTVRDATPSKSATDENFPVGSWLLPATLRRHVAIYYAFARAIDDIADDPARSPERKTTELDEMEAVLRGAAPETAEQDKAARLRLSLDETGVPIAHAADLCVAFRRDAVNPRCRDWAELMHYCRYSAAPVGRYLLDLHGESRDTWPSSDALCASLQVINHLQDCQKDFHELDRVYLPLDWLDAAGMDVGALAAPRASPALRSVLDRALDGVDALNAEARALPGLIGNRRMRMEAAVIVNIADRLAGLLRARDPLATRVELSTADKLVCLGGGLRRALW